VAEFIAAAEEAALIPCFFSAGAATQAAVPGGWRALVVADDTIVDLPGSPTPASGGTRCARPSTAPDARR
jgi:hypothetical protein